MTAKIEQAKIDENQKKNFTIIKKIAKHGSQSIIVIPRILEEHLKSGTIVHYRQHLILDKWADFFIY